MTKRYSLLACAMAVGLAFAGAGAVADVCYSSTTSMSVSTPSYGVYVDPDTGDSWYTIWGAVSQTVDTGTVGPAAGAGCVIQILSDTDGGGPLNPPGENDPQVELSTNWQNVCNIPCGSHNYAVAANSRSYVLLEPRTTVPSPKYYATKGIFGSVPVYAKGPPYHSPCDGKGPWSAIYQVSAYTQPQG